MDDIQQILYSIRKMLMKIGFSEVVVTSAYRSEENYALGNLFCRPLYLKNYGFLIEYADSYEEAQICKYDDGNLYPLSMGETVIIEELENEVRRILGEPQ